MWTYCVLEQTYTFKILSGSFFKILKLEYNRLHFYESSKNDMNFNLKQKLLKDSNISPKFCLKFRVM